MRVCRGVLFLLGFLSLVACQNSKITSLDQKRVAPGEQFTIHGEDLDAAIDVILNRYPPGW